MLTAKLILVGCGHMGGPLLEGWLERGVEGRHVTVIEPNPAIARSLTERDLTVLDSPDAIDVRPDAVVFAVKPQIMDEAVSAYRRFSGFGAVFLSIAAGKTLAFLEQRLGDEAAVVRSMPNTPAMVRRGITVACPNVRITPQQQRLCHDLLESVGEVAWIEDEFLLDGVTAVSGNGPAYVFLLVECMARAGVEAGLPEDLAQRIARATVSGAGELLRQSADGPDVLRENVTTPGGTNAAAMEVLRAPDGLDSLMIRAVAAAAKRSRELGG